MPKFEMHPCTAAAIAQNPCCRLAASLDAALMPRVGSGSTRAAAKFYSGWPICQGLCAPLEMFAAGVRGKHSEMDTFNTSNGDFDFQNYCAYQAKVAKIMEAGAKKEREGLIELENAINRLIEDYERENGVDIQIQLNSNFSVCNKFRLSGGVEREWKKAKAYGACLLKPNP